MKGLENIPIGYNEIDLLKTEIYRKFLIESYKGKTLLVFSEGDII